MTTLILTVVAFFIGIDDISTKLFRRPLLIAPIVGFILGDMQAALAIGATLEIMWMGVGNVGAYMAPDIITGTLISTSLAIISRGSGSLSDTVATAVALAVPTALLSQQLLVLIETVNVSLNSWAHKLADNADVKGTRWLNYPPAILTGLARALPTFLALQFGSEAIQKALEVLPTFIIDGLGVAGKIIPAVGIALLMLSMIKKAELWLFLILGFVLAAYLELAILPITLIALVVAYLYDLGTRTTPQVASPEVSTFDVEDDDDEVYDL
ncbi:PTS sugar transporter subunit IIC [Aerococcus sp. UMB1112A]|uniref:PTS mannose/fructose/sorbose/N-acetylgalactosamine transporter subunit IIC n=1 Tax=Aerococcus sp. UMB1112A TaxID=3050609 RepID=UPI00254B34D6|nr:PTS sugar transporter subunit IIC [Aerococcus sp. UMB1112A]MDK8502436.1 PTS sugar transporter subunit IIC [Aerococcus sp. UMB1112A]